MNWFESQGNCSLQVRSCLLVAESVSGGVTAGETSPRPVGWRHNESVEAARRIPVNSPFDPGRRAILFSLLGAPFVEFGAQSATRRAVPVLTYHRFGPTAADSMTVRTANFDAHLRVIERLECQVITLADWVRWRRGERATLPERAVVLTVDDAHRSQFEVMAPRLAARGWPVTLFVYPSAISNASYAMTWPQLRELVATPGFSVQSHTFWHPNFLQERKRMTAEAFRQFADAQLRRSREVLQQRLSQPASLLAWPFGASDTDLWTRAADCGYAAAFALGNRPASTEAPLYAAPRYLIVDSISERQLEARLTSAFGTTHDR